MHCRQAHGGVPRRLGRYGTQQLHLAQAPAAQHTAPDIRCRPTLSSSVTMAEPALRM